MKNGFTLVELSIALVIIGLLIGGILVGQSLIESAKINSQVSQIQQFDAAVLTFKAKYKYLPGDARGFGGNGDGYINMGGYTCCQGNADLLAGELPNVWAQLFPEEFVSSPYNILATANNSGATQNFPLSKIGKEGSIIHATAETYTNTNNYMILPWPVFQANGRISTTRDAGTGALTPADMRLLDSKLDDGFANSGTLRSGQINCCNIGGGAPRILAPTTCSSGASYLTSNIGYECTPMIRIGAQAGSVQ